MIQLLHRVCYVIHPTGNSIQLSSLALSAPYSYIAGLDYNTGYQIPWIRSRQTAAMNNTTTSLPYVRDTASTSQHLATYPSYHQPNDGYPVSPATEHDQDDYDDELFEGDLDPEAAIGVDGTAQYWAAKRHQGPRKSDSVEDEYGKSASCRTVPCNRVHADVVVGWRLKSRLKTFNAGLFICLNLGVDPPDVVKTNPCAKLECWLDPTALPSSKAIEAIGRSESIPTALR